MVAVALQPSDRCRGSRTNGRAAVARRPRSPVASAASVGCWVRHDFSAWALDAAAFWRQDRRVRGLVARVGAPLGRIPGGVSRALLASVLR